MDEGQARFEALLDARELAVSWGTWTYTVRYRRLGATPAPAAPKNPRSLLRERGLG
jgi:hypothetical protein